MKIPAVISVLIFGALLLYGSFSFPPWGDPNSPAGAHVSRRYIEKSIEETSVPNVVTSVLADYRGYDTMFETIVIFTAGIACMLLLRTSGRVDRQSRLYRHIPTGITLRITEGGRFPEDSKEFEQIDLIWVPYHMIVKTTGRLIIPFIQLFALYVIAHGHHSPGGGFQGGVILGASFILFALVFNLRSTRIRMKERIVYFLGAVGVFVYAGTGVLDILLGANFLDYSVLSRLFGDGTVMARSHGILIVEIGVAIAVMAVMIGLYYNLASAGRQDEGL